MIKDKVQINYLTLFGKLKESMLLALRFFFDKCQAYAFIPHKLQHLYKQLILHTHTHSFYY